MIERPSEARNRVNRAVKLSRRVGAWPTRASPQRTEPGHRANGLIGKARSSRSARKSARDWNSAHSESHDNRRASIGSSKKPCRCAVSRRVIACSARLGVRLAWVFRLSEALSSPATDATA